MANREEKVPAIPAPSKEFEKLFEDFLAHENAQMEALLADALKPAPREPDIMRDTLVRYLGYANEVGESFRAIAPKLVAPSYVLAFGYAFADSAMKCYGERKYEDGRPVAALVDTLAWQSFASVMLPGLAINRVVAASSFLLSSTPVPPAAKRWLPVWIGLSTIPLIIHPIDDFVESMMNRSLRKLTKFTPRIPHEYGPPIINLNTLFPPKSTPK